MKRFSLAMLAVTTVATTAVTWSPAKWATSLPEIAMCLVALMWAIQMARGREVKTAWVIAPLLGIVALAGAQIAFGFTVYRWPTRMAALYWAGNLAVLFIGLQIFPERETRGTYLNALLWFGGFVAIFSTIHSMTSPSQVYWTFQQPWEVIFGPFLYVNQFAAFVELLLPIAIFGALTREKGRVSCIILAAILYGSVLYSGSRGGAALASLEMLIVPLLTARRQNLSSRHLLNTGAVALVALLWVSVAAGPDKLIGKLTDGQFDVSRYEFNRASLLMFRDRPFQGFGLRNWPTAYPGYAAMDDGRFSNQAHNDWFQWAVEGGIPMVCLMLLVAIWAVPRALRSGWGVGVPAILLHSLIDYPLQRSIVALVFFTLLAAIADYGPGHRPRRLPEGRPDFEEPNPEEPNPEDDDRNLPERLSSKHETPDSRSHRNGGGAAPRGFSTPGTSRDY